MALAVFDRVMETATTTGTGAFTLAGAYTGYRAFSAVCSVADTCYYAIEAVDANGNPSGDWEVGLGTYSSANTLTRTTPAASSNAGAAVNFSAGTKRVILDASAGYLTGMLRASNNLSDVTAATARANLAVDYYRIGFFFTTTPTSSEVLLLHVATDAFTLPANLATPNSKVSVGTNPTSTFALDVQKNGSTIATISIATNGAATLTTVSGTSKSIAVGDVIKVVGPTADATIANVAITLRGSF